MSDIVVPKCAISDHFPVGVARCANQCNFDKNVSKYITYRCFKQFNENSFVNQLLSSGILEVGTLDDPNKFHIYFKMYS